MSTENDFEHRFLWLSPSVQKLPDLRDKDKEKWQANKWLCCYQQFDPQSQVDFTNTADSQDYHYQELNEMI